MIPKTKKTIDFARCFLVQRRFQNTSREWRQMKNPWLNLPCWLFVYVMFRGMCTTVYEFCGRALEAMRGPIEDGGRTAENQLERITSEEHDFYWCGGASLETVLLIRRFSVKICD
jgi:hypothetical protein